MDNLTLPFSIKSVADSGVIEGVISAFDQVDSYGDTIARGAYAKSIARLASDGRKLPALYQHDARRPIGVWSKLEERADGLHGRAELALEVRDAQEAHALARKGALTGISIGFEVPEGGSRQDGNRRILTEIDLWEASLVTFPADRHARVTSVKELPQSVDEVRECLRQMGFASRDAIAMAGAWDARRKSNDTDEAAKAVILGSLARLGKL